MRDFDAGATHAGDTCGAASGAHFRIAGTSANEDVQTTESGLQYIVIEPGEGDSPVAADSVEVHYEGRLIDGSVFDSSFERGQTVTFGLTQVIPGWTEGLQLMVDGEKRRFWIPGNLAYGEKPSRPGAPAGTLVFDVELISFTPAPTVKAPADVGEAPEDATRTASGLAYKVLKKGSGEAHPAATSVVRVHYSGWTTDGELFDSSVLRGQPATFPLNRVIPGWTEGLQLMVKGEKTRFWIPATLAYGVKPARPGAPAGARRVRRGGRRPSHRAGRGGRDDGLAGRPRTRVRPRRRRRRLDLRVCRVYGGELPWPR
mgnify:CR=1 FL=1